MTDTKKLSSTIKRADDGTITLTVSISQAKIAKAREEAIDRAVKNAELPGFRQGKAPRKMVEERLDNEKVTEDVLKQFLPNAYVEAVKEHNLNPIINPKIHVEKLGKDEDWQFTAQTCEVPEIKLNNYKEAVKQVTAKSKILVPGKEEKGPNFDEIMKVMVNETTVKVPKILIEGEVERLLAQLLQEIKSLGLSLDQYLASTKKNVEDVKKEYEIKAEADIKLEFALQKIAEEEKITVDPKEIEEALTKAKDDAERKQLEANVYLLANILRQQKTLDFLKNL